MITFALTLDNYTPPRSKIREHLKKIGDNSEQTRNAKHS